MGIGVGILLVAVGAVLRWAVTATTSGVNLHILGDILMVVGLASIVITLVILAGASRQINKFHDRF